VLWALILERFVLKWQDTFGGPIIANSEIVMAHMGILGERDGCGMGRLYWNFVEWRTAIGLYPTVKHRFGPEKKNCGISNTDFGAI